MSASDDILALAGLCQAAAHEVVNALGALGPRPSDPDAAKMLWDQTAARLQAQLGNLSMLQSKLTAAAITTGLDEAAADLARLNQVSASAEARIQQIKDIAKLMTTVSAILDVGLAVLGVAAAPNPVTIANLVDKIGGLATQL